MTRQQALLRCEKIIKKGTGYMRDNNWKEGKRMIEDHEGNTEHTVWIAVFGPYAGIWSEKNKVFYIRNGNDKLVEQHIINTDQPEQEE